MQRLLLLLLYCLWSPLHALDKLPDRLQLSYVVESYSLTLGKVIKSLAIKQGIYTTTTSMEPSLKVKLFTTVNIDEISRFYVLNRKVIPLSYQAKRTGSKPYNRLVNFDHDNKTTIYSSGKTEALLENTYDIGNIAFALMLENTDALKNKQFVINDGESNRFYKALAPGLESIKTAAGQFETDKITLKRQGHKGRFYHIWLDHTNKLPIKISREKNGRFYTMTLQSISP